MNFQAAFKLVIVLAMLLTSALIIFSGESAGPQNAIAPLYLANGGIQVGEK